MALNIANHQDSETVHEHDEQFGISDPQFMRDLKRLKQLRSFLIQEALIPPDEQNSPIDFKRLNMLHYSYALGRSPTEGEWYQVETLTRALLGDLQNH